MGLKSFIQNHLHEKNLKRYKLELARQSNAYQAYINVEENDAVKRLVKVSEAGLVNEDVKVCFYDELKRDADVLESRTKYFIFVNGDGLLSESGINLVARKFDDDPELDLIYFDEDEIDKESLYRDNPWFKPEFGPDSLIGSFYFGNILAIRQSAFSEGYYPSSENGMVNLYGMILDYYVRTKKEAFHEPLVLFHRYKNEKEAEALSGAEPMFDGIKLRAYEKLGIKATFNQDDYGVSHAVCANKGEKILIVIPSKDHPDVLERCTKSIRELSTYKNYDVVVVDNGSSDDNKSLYQALSQKYDFEYIYETMDFNFSKMCNKGAKSKESDYILFLNDDTEVITNNWLEIMLGQARIEGTGAVGAKLLYPDGETIQHVGVTNMTEGPSHKLQGHKDDKNIYHGANRYDRNVFGVTAACLMISRDRFDEVNRFNEELNVAYNDVCLCFSLYAKGYNNVIRNDVKLLHYESLSRGNDHISHEKMERLKKERFYLYSLFPMYYGVDPFYSMSLTGASEEYECILPFENRNIKPVSTISQANPANCPLNETLIISVDHAELERLWRDESCLLIDLHSHVRGLDNADYEFRMFLRSEDYSFEIPVIRRIRPDVIKVLYNEINVELSGFVARVPRDLLPSGNYEVWMEAKSLISRQVLVNKADCLIDVNDCKMTIVENV